MYITLCQLMGFRSLFRGSRSRSEIVATFLAVLELCKDRRVRLTGNERDCTVAAVSESAGQSEEAG